MSAPSVYSAIHAISAELALQGVPKDRIHEAEGYRYRSIDDLLSYLAPLLAKHRLCILPRTLKRTAVERTDECQRLIFHVWLKVAFSLTSIDDGTSHTIKAYGEALDANDKATAKAMSAAYKSAIVQCFCISSAGTEDADRSSLEVVSSNHSPEPVQGWEQWARDIEDLVSVCETGSAIELVQERNRQLLIALSRERQDLYHQLGECFGARREAISLVARQPRKTRLQSKSRKVALREEVSA